MPDPTWEPELSWHLIQIGGSIFQISAEVRKEIETWMHDVQCDAANDPTICKTAYLTVEGFSGEELTILFDGIICLYSSTPETRFKNRTIAKAVKDEALEQGLPDDD